MTWRTLPACAYPCPAICKEPAQILRNFLDYAITIFLFLSLFFLYLASFDLMTRYLGEGQQLYNAVSRLGGTHFHWNSRCKNSCSLLSRSSPSYPFVSSTRGKLPRRPGSQLHPRTHQAHPASAYQPSPVARCHRTKFVHRLLMHGHDGNIALPR